MIINKKRINSVNRYLKYFNGVKEIYISVPANKDNIDLLKEKFEITEYEVGRKIVPPDCGPVTRYNCNGKEIIHRDRPKEKRVFERDYHIIDWHHNDYYGTCFQTRMCYPKTLLEPPLEELILYDQIICSNLIGISEPERLKHVINMFLEIFGYCEILDTNEKPINKEIDLKVVSWKILPPGKYPWNIAKRELENYFRKSSNKNKRVLENRHASIAKFNPDFMAIGQEHFNGYVVYGFTKMDLYVFESNKINNATYVFKGQWEEAAKLTKADIINGRLCHERIIHTKDWKKKIENIFE